MTQIIERLYAENPIDGTDTFNQVRFYEATDSSGTGTALIAIVSIDTTTINPIDPGFTMYTHTTGDNTKYVSATYYSTTNNNETRRSDWVLQGQDRWDTMFTSELQDSTSSVWTATDRSYIKGKALQALFPDFFYESIDTSLTVVNNSTTQTKIYTVPIGIFQISEVGVGNPNSFTQPFRLVIQDNWEFEQNKLRFFNMSGLSDTYPLRIVASKKYMEVGQVPTRLDPLAMLYMKMSAYQKLADDYPRYLKWSRLQKGNKVTLEGLRLLIKDLRNQFEEERGRQKSLFRSGRI